MISSLVILVIIVVVIVSVANSRSSRVDPPEGAGTPSPGDGFDGDLARRLGEWAAAGLISSDQAEGILEHERAALPPPAAPPVGVASSVTPRRVPLVAEALGYLGGILGIVGVVLLIARYWPDMADGVRLAIAVAGAIVAIGAGIAVPADGEAALVRLRWFLWLVGTASAGVVGGVVSHDLLGFDTSREESRVVLGVALAVAVVSAVVWAGRERPVQQLTMSVGAAVALGTFVEDVAHIGWAGLAVWALGTGFVVVGVTTPVATPAVWSTVGAAVLIVGAGMSSDRWTGEGLLLAVGSALGCVVLGSVMAGLRGPVDPTVHRSTADRLRSAGPTGLVVVGALAMLQLAPMTVGHFADRAGVATGAVVWAGGVAAQVIADRARIRLPLVVGVIGGVALVVGPAVMGVQSESVATLFGLVSAAALVALGSMPGRVLLSLIGSVGLLVNVPWSISHFFPGEGRAPLLIATSGGVIILVAVLIARSGGRLRTELRRDAAR